LHRRLGARVGCPVVRLGRHADADNHRVLKLAARSSIQAVLSFTGLHGPTAVAMDTAGNLYVTDYSNNRVVKLAAG
jgi:serine/threonine protein kinase, bacterial